MDRTLFQSGRMGIALNILMAAYLFQKNRNEEEKQALFLSALDFTAKFFPDKPRGQILKNNESARHLIFAMILSQSSESTEPFVEENWISFEDQSDFLDKISLFDSFDYELQQAQAYLYHKYSIFAPYRKHDGTPAITDTYVAHLAKQEQDGTIDSSGKEVLNLLQQGRKPASSSGCLLVLLLFIVCLSLVVCVS